MEKVFQDFIYFRTYSRGDENLGRREFGDESINRYENYGLKLVPKSRQKEYKQACEAKRNHEIMGSMRMLGTAGKALDREGLCAYNCSYTVIDNIKSFSEILYLLMNGVGVGYSVERQYINKLPEVPEKFEYIDEEIIFADSKLGGAEGLNKYLKKLGNGEILKCNFDKIRPKGSPLKTFGGRASGSQVLENLIEFITNLLLPAKGRKLNSTEVNDICCYIASIVVVGGTRRAACLSLSNPSDDRMRHAKDGQFGNTHPYRTLANNSGAYTEKPSSDNFLSEFLSLIRSGSGERGIFNREACEQAIKQQENRKPGYEGGVNPCGERVLRPRGLCNLTEVIIRADDTKEILCKKVRQAAILGCVQSKITNFNFVSREGKKNTEEERLIGVSLTGLRDHFVLNKVSREAKLGLTELKQVVQETAREGADVLEMNVPACTTCVKPSGTVSALCGTSSGLHTRYAQYYIRRVRVADLDPISKLLRDYGVPHKPEVGQSGENTDTWVFEFPIKSPETSVLQEDVSAIEQLNYGLLLKKYWCTGNPSCTIHVEEDEGVEIASWVYTHGDYIVGITFLPKSKAVYQLMPFEEIDEFKYNELKKTFPKVDFTLLTKYEETDRTSGATEYACSADGCEVK